MKEGGTVSDAMSVLSSGQIWSWEIWPSTVISAVTLWPLVELPTTPWGCFVLKMLTELMSGSHCYGHIFQTPKTWNIETALLWCICKLLPFLLNFLIEHLYLLLKWKLSFADSSIVAWLKEVRSWIHELTISCAVLDRVAWVLREARTTVYCLKCCSFLLMCCSSSWSILLVLCSGTRPNESDNIPRLEFNYNNL